MLATDQQYYSPDEYLALEDGAEYRSEYIDGLIIPITGGTTNHNRISLNLSATLNFAFKHENYEVLIGDVKLWIPERRIYTYPDVMVVAGEVEYVENRADIIVNPQVIVEVLSDSTKSYDREGKFEAYRTIPTFQEYLLIDQSRIHVEQYAKSATKRWTFCEYDADDTAVALVSLSFEITLADLYRKVAFASPSEVPPTTE